MPQPAQKGTPALWKPPKVGEHSKRRLLETQCFTLKASKLSNNYLIITWRDVLTFGSGA